MMAHDWPDNVRELRNLLEYATIVTYAATCSSRNTCVCSRAYPAKKSRPVTTGSVAESTALLSVAIPMNQTKETGVMATGIPL